MLLISSITLSIGRGEISDVSHDPGELKIMVLTDKGGVEIHSIKELKLIEEVK